MKHDSCSQTCNVTFAVSKKKQRALNPQWTDFSGYWAEFLAAALGVFDRKINKSQFREESSYTDMAVVPGGHPKQTPREQRYSPGDQKGFKPGCSNSDRPGSSSRMSSTQKAMQWSLRDTRFLQLHWKSRVVYSSHYLLNQGAEARSQSSDLLGSSCTNSSTEWKHSRINLGLEFSN